MTINKGDKIKTTTQDWYTVIEVWDNVITVSGSFSKVHVSNVLRVVKA
jgi:hypothetical protein